MNVFSPKDTSMSNWLRKHDLGTAQDDGYNLCIENATKLFK